jgi:drug/metabolite transporter (DMT)-like permease
MTQPQITSTALLGIIFMLCNTAALAISDIASKLLRTDLSSGFIVFLYKFGLLLITLPWIFSTGTKAIKTHRLHFHILRSFFGTLGIIFFVQGLKYVTMVSAAAFENLQYLIVILFSMIFFDDKLNKTKLFAIIMGFLGACIVVNPDLISNIFIKNCQDINTKEDSSFFKYTYTFLAICCWSVNTLLVKVLGNTEQNRTQMFYLLLFSSLWSFPAAFIKWESFTILNKSMPLVPTLFDPGFSLLTSDHLMLLALMGGCYFIHGIAYFNALKYDLSIVVPFRYSKLLFSGFLGYVLFQEKLDPYSLPGYLLVILSSFILIRYEIKRKRSAKVS